MKRNKSNKNNIQCKLRARKFRDIIMVSSDRAAVAYNIYRAECECNLPIKNVLFFFLILLYSTVVACCSYVL